MRCSADEEWTAFGGVVTLRTDEGSQSRMDGERSFEKRLLASAPKGMLPSDLINDE
jgi:hypothetical protein